MLKTEGKHKTQRYLSWAVQRDLPSKLMSISGELRTMIEIFLRQLDMVSDFTIACFVSTETIESGRKIKKWIGRMLFDNS